ncbi:MAG: Lrp/AsnC ligand binding domain-containing protein [Chloroflexi bacterium]|nr:Lrp/AsnC ligand binding domain-containing protein [Chloroflexota bacterium]
MASKAYILITVDTASTQQVVRRLQEVPAVVAVHEVLGPYDIVVEVEAPTHEDLIAALRHQIRSIRGIVNTVTCTWL